MQEVDMDAETDFDGWESLAARREAEDEMLIQRYASGAGRGSDMRPVRSFVRHVRNDLGPKAVIHGVEMIQSDAGHEVRVTYSLPPDGRSDTPARTLLDGGVAAAAMHPGVAVPMSSTNADAGSAVQSATTACDVCDRQHADQAVLEHDPGDALPKECGRGGGRPFGGRAIPLSPLLPFGVPAGQPADPPPPSPQLQTVRHREGSADAVSSTF
jgi:hypothetical protein